MRSSKVRFGTAAGVAVAAAFATACAPSHDQQVARGAYLVRIMGCSDCHTPGGLTPKPDMTRFLGGSDADFVVPGLGTVVPPNLTPDKGTGIGTWTTDQIVMAFTTGATPSGRTLAPVMPWKMDFSHLTKTDATDIALYLQSLPAVSHSIPGPSGPRTCIARAELCVVGRDPLPH
jgi:mono/diheme cytochrome c family protein